ncbi:MAG: FISUMP domain-containing protein [Sphingobacteriales bacterium]
MLQHLNAQQYGSFKDTRDGKVYKTVKIGEQEWMAENLNTDRFRNGDLIPEAKTIEEWEKAGRNKQPVWCYYDNKGENGIKYGKLYNWYAVNDPRELAPFGWEVPKEEDFNTLISILKKRGFKYDISSEKNIDLQLKSKYEWDIISYIHHVDRVPSAVNKITNSTGWSAKPGGVRTFNGKFMGRGSLAFWYLQNSEIPFQMGDFDGDIDVPSAGCSVRCIKY